MYFRLIPVELGGPLRDSGCRAAVLRAGRTQSFSADTLSSRSLLTLGAGPGGQTLTREAPRQPPAGLEAQGFAEGLLCPLSLLSGHVGAEGTWGLPPTRPSPVTLQEPLCKPHPTTHTPPV